METCESADKLLNVILSISFIFCLKLNMILQDKTELEKISLIKDDLKTYLVTCKKELGGNGNILKKFNIDD